MRNDHERILDILEAIQRIEQVSSHGKDAFYHDELVQVSSAELNSPLRSVLFPQSS